MTWNKTVHCLSKIFQPINVIPKDAILTSHKDVITSKSQKLMLELGIIRQANPGCFHLLPLGVRSLEKLVTIVDNEMKSIGGQKVILPTLTNATLWRTSGRLDTVALELFTINDRHSHSYILSPTHEEAVSDLIASLAPISYKQFPLKLYQITSKFRDEIKPRFGLMRSRQFLMKDMYSFDVSSESATNTYREVAESYDRIFKQIGIDCTRVKGSAGHMGGTLSHEYHYQADIGEDKILTCSKCNYLANTVDENNKCPKCGSQTDIKINCGIEVGHTFMLGDRYSKALKAMCLAKHDGKPVALQMGSYGLGLTRIMAAAVEVMSLENEIRWPVVLAPYKVVILPPKAGSKEDASAVNLSSELYQQLELLPNLRNDVLLDDRTSLTIGRRFIEARKVGYPYIVVLGQKIVEEPPFYELNDLTLNKQLYLSKNDLFNYFTNI